MDHHKNHQPHGHGNAHYVKHASTQHNNTHGQEAERKNADAKKMILPSSQRLAANQREPTQVRQPATANGLKRLVSYWWFLGDLRVCVYCGRVVLTYLKSAEINSELSPEHLALLNELQEKFGDSSDLEVVEGKIVATPDREEIRRKQSVGYQEERFGSSGSPLYVLPHSKTVLMQAIHNDTLFLASQSVMDYSLLVGLDETNSHLVLGIIDYIRGYTWDKKIETMVKRIGQAKDPTIIPADEYRKRFIAAMHRYFLPVPDRWTGLCQGIDVYTRDIAG
ncbi:unnamed protein product [Nesidiocoris tenuis]|uniref:PIPK domain-containing protein n=1 Tax=Nesidiocoris tenuis TaxID=355587 RepID=A0A6H5FZ02_9HEMI|nr:unnamed protein product [Nesidiocoris tenuis]